MKRRTFMQSLLGLAGTISASVKGVFATPTSAHSPTATVQNVPLVTPEPLADKAFNECQVINRAFNGNGAPASEEIPQAPDLLTMKKPNGMHESWQEKKHRANASHASTSLSTSEANPTVVANQSTTGAEAGEHPLLLQYSTIAGYCYYDGARIDAYLKKGAKLTLRREPNNPHDDRAIAIYWHNRKLGYIPRQENATLAQMMDRAQPLTAKIHRKQPPTSPTWERVSVAVWAG